MSISKTTAWTNENACWFRETANARRNMLLKENIFRKGFQANAEHAGVKIMTTVAHADYVYEKDMVSPNRLGTKTARLKVDRALVTHTTLKGEIHARGRCRMPVLVNALLVSVAREGKL